VAGFHNAVKWDREFDGVAGRRGGDGLSMAKTVKDRLRWGESKIGRDGMGDTADLRGSGDEVKVNQTAQFECSLVKHGLPQRLQTLLDLKTW